jgi:transposase
MVREQPLMKRKRYSAEFRAQAVELVEHGRAPKEVAQELEIELSCLYAWLRKARAPANEAAACGDASDAAALKRLRRENQKLQLENAILKKAAIILGTNPPPERER